MLRKVESLGSYEKFYTKDINESTCWQTAFTGVGAIIHLAGCAHGKVKDPETVRRVNISGTLKLAEEAAASGVKRFVYVSSANVIELEKNPSSDVSIQTRTKYETELGLKKIANLSGMQIVIIRCPLVYGAKAPGNFSVLQKLVSKMPFLPFGLTNNRKSFISVQNLADLILLCIEHPNANGQTFLASDGHAISIKEFTNAMAEGLGKKVYQLPIPCSVMRFVGKLTGKTEVVDQLIGDFELDSYDAFKLLGWKPPYSMTQAMMSLTRD